MSPETKSSPSVGRAVDWKFAAAVGEKLARPGPAASDYTLRQVTEQLAESSRNAEVPVREVTGLIEGGAIPEARIVDRAQWIRAASQSMRVMTGGTDSPKGVISGRITGAQTGVCSRSCRRASSASTTRSDPTVVSSCWCIRT